MSSTSNESSIFAIKAGAYTQGGVAMNKSFLTYVDKNFLPIPPEKIITTNQYKSILSDTPINKGATLRLGLRSPRNLQEVVFLGNSNIPIEGVDFLTLGPNLTSDKALSQLIKVPDIKNNYFQLGNTLNESALEGAFYFNKTESDAKAFRNAFANDATLALTYSHLDNLTGARAPDSQNNPQLAYGKGYKLQFGQGAWPRTSGTLHSLNPNNFLVGVLESNLDNSSNDIKTWTCDPQRRYMIVRPEDRAANCPKENYSVLEDATYGNAFKEEHALLRRHLPAHLWDINVGLRCIVPKSPLVCYSTEKLNGATVPIMYDQTKECYHRDSLNTALTSRCAQFVSVCLRN